VSGADDLAARVRACRLCVVDPHGKPLPHEPRPVFVLSTTAKILIAGQAPGTRVHATGVPFNDPSGDRLRDWLGASRDQFYDADLFAILPMGFCFPGLDVHGGDLPPRRECAPAWRMQLLAAMPRIELVIAIGAYAQRWHLGGRRLPSLTATVQAWRDVFARDTTPRVLPLPHPSWRNSGWLKRNPWFEADLLPVLKREVHARIAK
jgi:uracil-DNA glycosylase